MKIYSICPPLSYFTKHNALHIHSFCCKWKFFIFLWLNGIPSCVCVCVYLYSILFIHSAVDGHLGCFHNLGYCKYRCYKHWSTCIFSNQCFYFLQIYTLEWHVFLYHQTEQTLFQGNLNSTSKWIWNNAPGSNFFSFLPIEGNKNKLLDGW